MSKDDSDLHDNSLSYEYMLMMVLGDRAYQTASLFGRHFYKKNISKLIKKYKKRVEGLNQIHIRLKDRLLSDFDNLEHDVKKISSYRDYKLLTIKLFRIINLLLGYDFLKGQVFCEPYYVRSMHNEIWERAYLEKDANLTKLIFSLESKLLSARQKIVTQLKKEGYTHAEIAEIMNISPKRVSEFIRINKNIKERNIK